MPEIIDLQNGGKLIIYKHDKGIPDTILYFNKENQLHKDWSDETGLIAPACIWSTGTREWLENDKFHRLVGPAIIGEKYKFPTEEDPWFIKGKRYVNLINFKRLEYLQRFVKFLKSSKHHTFYKPDNLGGIIIKNKLTKLVNEAEISEKKRASEVEEK